MILINMLVLDALILCHLPDGPTAHFKLTSVKGGWEIKVSNVSPFA